jgi:hypothetical protein
MKSKFEQAVEWFYGYLQSASGEGCDMRDWSTLNEIEADSVGVRPVEDLGHENIDSNKDERFWSTAFLLGVHRMYINEVTHQRPEDKIFEGDLLKRINEANKYEKYTVRRKS